MFYRSTYYLNYFYFMKHIQWEDARIHHVREDKNQHLFLQLEVQNVDTNYQEKSALRKYWSEDTQMRVAIEPVIEPFDDFREDISGYIPPNDNTND